MIFLDCVRLYYIFEWVENSDLNQFSLYFIIMAVLGAYCNLSVDFPLLRVSESLKLGLRIFFNWAATVE